MLKHRGVDEQIGELLIRRLIGKVVVLTVEGKVGGSGGFVSGK